jgi:serine/threonine-protein kinase
MAPEQIRAARDVDGRADIWALGVTLYQLLAQVPPFNTESLMVLITLVTMEQPTPLAEHRPDVPAGLAAVIMQCLEKDRTRRWPNVAALAAALAPYGNERARQYAARVASVAKVEVPESRPTTELPRPTEAALSAGAVAPLGAGTAGAVSAPVAPRAPGGSGRALAIAASVLALGLPLALFFGLRGRTTAGVAPASADPVVVPVVPAVTATATGADSTTAPEVSPPTPSGSAVAPAASSAAPRKTAPAARPTAAKAAEPAWGGTRR